MESQPWFVRDVCSGRGARPFDPIGNSSMIQTVEGIIDSDGVVRLLEPVSIGAPCRALVTILQEPPEVTSREAALLSEKPLAADWNRPEEDLAGAHLRSVKPCPVPDSCGSNRRGPRSSVAGRDTDSPRPTTPRSQTAPDRPSRSAAPEPRAASAIGPAGHQCGSHPCTRAQPRRAPSSTCSSRHRCTQPTHAPRRAGCRNPRPAAQQLPQTAHQCCGNPAAAASRKIRSWNRSRQKWHQWQIRKCHGRG